MIKNNNKTGGVQMSKRFPFDKETLEMANKYAAKIIKKKKEKAAANQQLIARYFSGITKQEEIR